MPSVGSGPLTPALRWPSLLLTLLLAAASAEVRWQPVAEPPGESYKLTLPILAEPDWPLDGRVVIQFDAGSSGAHYAAELEALKVRLVKIAADGARTVCWPRPSITRPSPPRR